MADRGDVSATQVERLFDGSRQLLVAELAAHGAERPHGTGAGLASLPLDHLLPDAVVTLRPPALGTPLRQRRRSAQRSRLPVQYVEVVFQIEDLLQSAVTTLVAGDPGAVVTELDHAGIDAGFDDRARLQRHGIRVRPHL